MAFKVEFKKAILTILILIGLVFLIMIQMTQISLAAEEVKYRFDERLCDANWTSSAPGPGLSILPCPGETDDSRGFVRMVPEVTRLEDNSLAIRTFQTHPMWQTGGWIAGTFELSQSGISIQMGDRLVGQIGFLEGAGAGRVQFTIQYDQNPVEPGGVVTLFDTEKVYDESLVDIDIDLSPYAGQNGDIILKVDANGVSDQDWAVWKEIRIQQPNHSTSTFTRTLQPVLTLTATRTMTQIPTPTPPAFPTGTLTQTPTQTPTSTPTEVVTFPPPSIITAEPRPCACYESNKIGTHFSGNDGFGVGHFIRDKDLLIVTAVDERASGDNGLFTIMDPLGIPVSTFEARFTPNDVIAVGDVWGDDTEEEILVGIDEDHLVYVYNAWGDLLETKSIYYTRYDILVTGNVLNGPDFEGDEIIFASDERDVFVIYGRAGTVNTYGLFWDFEGNSVPGIKNSSHSDGLTTGNVLGDELDEILFVENQNGDHSILYIYNGQGILLAKTRIRFTHYDTLAAGDVMGNDYDEVLVGIDEDRAIYALDALKGILKMFHGRVTPVDIIATGKFEGHEKEAIFLAVDDDNMIYFYLQE
jgi:hypothetical protein